MDDDEEEGNSPASHQWILPSKAFDGLWDSLVFDTDVKARVGLKMRITFMKYSILFSIVVFIVPNIFPCNFS